MPLLCQFIPSVTPKKKVTKIYISKKKKVIVRSTIVTRSQSKSPIKNRNQREKVIVVPGPSKRKRTDMDEKDIDYVPKKKYVGTSSKIRGSGQNGIRGGGQKVTRDGGQKVCC